MDSRVVNSIINAAAEKISVMEPGTLIQHDVMRNMLSEDSDNPLSNTQYGYMMSRLRQELQQYGIFLRTLRGRGYLIVPAGEEIDLCFGEFKAGQRKMMRATAKTTFIRVDRITDAEKLQKTITTAQKMANLIGLLKMGGFKTVIPNKQITGKVNLTGM